MHTALPAPAFGTRHLPARLHLQLCRYKKGGYSNHTGHPADERMTEAASKRGVVLTSRSRPLEPSDLASFDYLVGMDDSNLKDMRIAVEYWEHNGAPIPKGWGIKASVWLAQVQAPCHC